MLLTRTVRMRWCERTKRGRMQQRAWYVGVGVRACVYMFVFVRVDVVWWLWDIFLASQMVNFICITLVLDFVFYFLFCFQVVFGLVYVSGAKTKHNNERCFNWFLICCLCSFDFFFFCECVRAENDYLLLL